MKKRSTTRTDFAKNFVTNRWGLPGRSGAHFWRWTNPLRWHLSDGLSREGGGPSEPRYRREAAP